MIDVLADLPGMMASPAAFGTLATAPVGSGPLRVVSITNNSVAYERWDGYHDKDLIKFARYEVTQLSDDATRASALFAGQADFGGIRTDTVAQAKASGTSVVSGPGLVSFLALNAAQRRSPSPLVRQALMHAIDREAINKALFGGGCKPLSQTAPEGSWATWTSTRRSTRASTPPLAKSMLASAGYPRRVRAEGRRPRPHVVLPAGAGTAGTAR